MCGMTEAGVVGGNPPAAPRLGSIGPAVRHLDARFVDETGARCPPGREGEPVVGGRQMASACLTERGTLVEIPREAFATGDVGHVDAAGYLFLTGRKKDLIIRGGVNIAPLEITSALLAHPSVADAATLGVPDPLYGEAIVGFVVFGPGLAPGPDELLAHCRTRLSDFKLPQRIVVLEAIPRTDRGKVTREALEAIWRREVAAGTRVPPGRPVTPAVSGRRRRGRYLHTVSLRTISSNALSARALTSSRVSGWIGCATTTVR